MGKWAESPQTLDFTGFFRARFHFWKWAKTHKSGQKPLPFLEVALKKWAKPASIFGSSIFGSKNGHKNSPSVASFRPKNRLADTPNRLFHTQNIILIHLIKHGIMTNCCFSNTEWESKSTINHQYNMSKWHPKECLKFLSFYRFSCSYVFSFQMNILS